MQVNAKQVSELRANTGAGIMDCKKALAESEGDIEKATEYLRKQLLRRRKEGGAVLLVSEDLEEIFELCDRIAVMFQGEFMGVLRADDPRLKDIGLMMAGSLRLQG